MLLGAIVVGISYLYFSQFQQYLTKVGESSEHYVQLGQFNMLIHKDLNEADEIYIKHPSDVRFIAGETSLDYNFADERIIRSLNSQKDTFFLKISEFNFQEIKDHNRLVKKISFYLTTRDEEQHFFLLHKQYTAETLFNSYEK